LCAREGFVVLPRFPTRAHMRAGICTRESKQSARVEMSASAEPISALTVALEDVWTFLDKKRLFSDHDSMAAIRNSWLRNRKTHPDCEALMLVAGVSMLDGLLDEDDWKMGGGGGGDFNEFVLENCTEAYVVWETQVVLCCYRGVLSPFSGLLVELARNIEEFCVPYDSPMLYMFSSNHMFTPAGLKDAVFHSQEGGGALDARAWVVPMVVVLPNIYWSETIYPSQSLIVDRLSRNEVPGYVASVMAAAAKTHVAGGKTGSVLVPYKDLVFLGYLLEKKNVSASTVSWRGGADAFTGILGLVDRAETTSPGVDVIVTGDGNALTPRAGTLLRMLGYDGKATRGSGVLLYISPMGVYVVVLQPAARTLLDAGVRVRSAMLGRLIERATDTTMTRKRQRDFVSLMDADVGDVLQDEGTGKAFRCVFVSFSDLRSMYAADRAGNLVISVLLRPAESIATRTITAFENLVDGVFPGAAALRQDAYDCAVASALPLHDGVGSAPGDMIDLAPPSTLDTERRSWVKLADYATRTDENRRWVYHLVASVCSILASAVKVTSTVERASMTTAAILFFPLSILLIMGKVLHEQRSEADFAVALEPAMRLCTVSNIESGCSAVVHLQADGGDVLSDAVKGITSKYVWYPYVHMANPRVVCHAPSLATHIWNHDVELLLCAAYPYPHESVTINATVGAARLTSSDILLLNHVALASTGDLGDDMPTHLPTPDNDKYTIQRYHDITGNRGGGMTVIHRALGDSGLEVVLNTPPDASREDIFEGAEKLATATLKARVETVADETGMASQEILDNISLVSPLANDADSDLGATSQETLSYDDPPQMSFEQSQLAGEQTRLAGEQTRLAGEQTRLAGEQTRLAGATIDHLANKYNVQRVSPVPSDPAPTAKDVYIATERDNAYSWMRSAKNDYVLATTNALIVSYIMYRALLRRKRIDPSKTSEKGVASGHRVTYEKGELEGIQMLKEHVPRYVMYFSGLMGLLMPISNASMVQNMMATSVYAYALFMVSRHVQDRRKTSLALKVVGMIFGADVLVMVFIRLFDDTAANLRKYFPNSNGTWEGVVQLLLDWAVVFRERGYDRLPLVARMPYEFIGDLAPNALQPYLNVAAAGVKGAVMLGAAGRVISTAALRRYVIPLPSL